MAKAATRAPAQQTAQQNAQPAAQEMRAPGIGHNIPPGRAVAVGRDGKPVYRSIGASSNDPYAIDERLVPPGWVYQWKRYSIYNQVDHTHLAKLAREGAWTPVPAERHDGIFLPPGTKGSVIHDGLILMERPIELEREAMRDEKNRADEAMRRAKAERGLPSPSAGINTQTAAARSASFVRQERATADDMAALQELPKGSYDYERNSID